MSSAARKKIDTQTMQLFDPEVEKPEHDEVVRRLFADSKALSTILMQFHRLKPLAPFSESDTVNLVDFPGYADSRIVRAVPFLEAVTLTKSSPSYIDLCPARIQHKQMEPLMYLPTGERTNRLIGFVDIGVRYTIVQPPYLERIDGGRQIVWRRNEERHGAIFEVKSAWPTSGALIRQLNLYAASFPAGLGIDGSVKVSRFAVGPDASLNELICAHGYRLITHDSESGAFNLQSNPIPPAPRRSDTDF